MIELEYNGERYLIDGGKWYRRLKVGDPLAGECQTIFNGTWKSLKDESVVEFLSPGRFSAESSQHYRVHCVDPRPPFKVGDRVKVARKDEGGWGSTQLGCEGVVHSICEKLCVAVELDGGMLIVQPWCLDLIEPEPTFGQTITERLTKHVEKTEQETAKVMKVKQWQLREAKEPKTLADVVSSRERPVLCWWSRYCILPLFTENNRVWRFHNDTCSPQQCDELVDANRLELYRQPSTPTKLEDVPDLRVISTPGSAGFALLWFREKSQWWFCPSEAIGFSDDHQITPHPDNWRLTDHCVELIETEVKVMG